MLEVTDVKFGFTNDLKAKIMYKVKRHLDDTKGRFPVGFMLLKDPIRLLLFKDSPDNTIGMCPPELLKDWLGAAIADKGYTSEIIYYTGVEELGNSGTFAMNVPRGVIQWMDLEVVLGEFKRMLSLVEQYCP